MGLSGNRGQKGECGACPPRPKPNWFRARGGAAPFPLVQYGPMGGAPPSLWPASSIPVWPNKAQYFSRRIPVTLRYSKKYPNHSKPFRRPNTIVLYIDLYLRSILDLLVMSVISSETPNNIRSPNHNSYITISSSKIKHADPTGSITM